MTQSNSTFADGVEFEETFPESPAKAAPAAVRIAAPSSVPEAAPRMAVARSDPVAAADDSLFEAKLERRRREAEALVKQESESARVEEERRLAEWVRSRREEEERLLTKWTDERRATVERSTDTRADGVVQRIEELLFDWQERFEKRLNEHHSIWRSEFESLLAERLLRNEDAASADRRRESGATDRGAITLATSARDVGRFLCDILSDLAPISAFALALHRDGRDDVVYRYRVAVADAVGTILRRDSLDDGPQSAAANMDGWDRAHRTVRAGTRDASVHTAQLAVRAAGATIGVLTLQSEAEPIPEDVLTRVTELVALAAPRLAELRDAGSFRGA